MLAEDERSVAFSIAFALKCDDHQVQIVADGEQTLASVRVEPDRFDLLITDHSMPGTTGIELVQRLREESHPIDFPANAMPQLRISSDRNVVYDGKS